MTHFAKQLPYNTKKNHAKKNFITIRPGTLMEPSLIMLIKIKNDTTSENYFVTIKLRRDNTFGIVGYV